MRTIHLDQNYDSVVQSNRQGVVGGTARAVALAYRKLNSQVPEAGIPEAALVALQSRYALFKTTNAKLRMAVLYHFLGAGEVRSLAHFVVLILTVEADLSDYTIEVQVASIEAITAELLTNGVPQDVVFGQDLLMAKSPEHLFLMYQDTMVNAVRLMNSDVLQTEEARREIDTLTSDTHPRPDREPSADGASLVGPAIFWSVVFLILLAILLG